MELSNWIELAIIGILIALILYRVARVFWLTAYQKGSSDRYKFFVEKWGSDWIDLVECKLKETSKDQ